jgi:drug/metabolite transporter (DMT)-like permease
VSIAFPTSGDRFTDTNGDLTGVWTAAAVGNVVGSGPATCPAGVGACIGWSTGAIVNARRLRGRTFIVPLSSNAYDLDGTLVSGAVSLLSTFGAAMMAAGPLMIWHRPTTDAPTSGTSSGVQAQKVRDKVAYLSSRRD